MLSYPAWLQTLSVQWQVQPRGLLVALASAPDPNLMTGLRSDKSQHIGKPDQVQGQRACA